MGSISESSENYLSTNLHWKMTLQTYDDLGMKLRQVFIFENNDLKKISRLLNLRKKTLKLKKISGSSEKVSKIGLATKITSQLNYQLMLAMTTTIS